LDENNYALALEVARAIPGEEETVEFLEGQLEAELLSAPERAAEEKREIHKNSRG